MLRVLSLLVENNPGVLARISGLFSGKGYNLESLTVGTSLDNNTSRITLVCNSNEGEFEQIKKQLNRLIDVVKVVDFTKKSTLDKELAFIKVQAKPNKRTEVFKLAEVFDSKISDLGAESMVLEICDSCEKIDGLISVLQPYGLLEIARSGLVAMECCKKK